MAGFQLKDFVSIVAAELNQARATQDRLTDFEVGAVARTIMEAPAIEVEELYQKIFAGILDAIPTSIYKAFDFELIGEAAASGQVVITFGVPIEVPFVVPAGVVFDAPSYNLKFATALDTPVAVGVSSVSLLVQCATPGTVGNVPAGAITGVVSYSLPLGSAVSNTAFISGKDAQSESERKARFVEFILSLSRGTEGAIRYAVRQARVETATGVLLEYVTRIGLREAPGQVDVFIYGSSGVPSAALIDIAQLTIDGRLDGDTGVYTPGFRSVGIDVRVRSMTEVPVNVSLKVDLLAGVSQSMAIVDRISTLLTTVFDAVESGGVLYVDQLLNAALTVPGVHKVIAENNTNVECAANQVLKLGTLTVEFLDA